MENLWVLPALVSAFALATSDALTKRALSVHNVYLIAWLRLLFSLPLLLACLLFVPVPRLDSHFYRTVLVALPLEVIAIILYTKALKISPLSLTNVAYMISVKRLSLLIGVFYGHVLFRESGIRERLLGTALMLTGFVLIVLFH